MLRRVVLIAASTLLAAEITGRLVLGLANPVLVQSDAACGYLVKPEQHIHRFFAQTDTNAYGMRSAALARSKPPGTYRLLCLGDSLLFGTSRVDQSALLTERLRSTLHSMLKRPVEVLNASASAWSPDNEWSYLQSRGIFSADHILWFLNSDDLGQKRSELNDVGQDLATAKPVSALLELWTRFLAPRFLRRSLRTDAGTDGMAANPVTVTHNLAVLSAGVRFASEQHTALTIVFLPFRRRIAEGVQASVPRPLTEWAAAACVPVTDLTPAISVHSARSITLDNGTHLNAFGHRVVAAALLAHWPLADKAGPCSPRSSTPQRPQQR